MSGPNPGQQTADTGQDQGVVLSLIMLLPLDEDEHIVTEARHQQCLTHIGQTPAGRVQCGPAAGVLNTAIVSICSINAILLD